MNRLEFCKQCKKREFEFKQGTICGLTKEKPSFEDNCTDFEPDGTVGKFVSGKLRTNESRGKIVLALIGVVLILEFASLISSGLQYNLLQTVSNGGDISDEMANANDMRERVIAIVYLIAYIASGVSFIMWFRRAYYNLHQKVNTLSFDEGWAAGSWFVPIVNLYRPLHIMKELYEETKKIISNTNHSIQYHLDTKFLGLWWGLWIINGILGQIISRLSKDAETLPELVTNTTLDMVGSVFGIALGIITIKVVKDYTKAETVLFEER